jgi:hypothetical protein
MSLITKPIGMLPIQHNVPILFLQRSFLASPKNKNRNATTMMRSSCLAVLLLSITAPSVLAGAVPSFGPQLHNSRWGAFCPGFLEPLFCISDVADYWIEETCADANNTQMQALTDFYFFTGNKDDSGPLHELGWLSGCDYCSWGGVKCNAEGNVTGINVSEWIESCVSFLAKSQLICCLTFFLDCFVFVIAEMDPPLTGMIPTELAELESLGMVHAGGRRFSRLM